MTTLAPLEPVATDDESATFVRSRLSAGSLIAFGGALLLVVVFVLVPLLAILWQSLRLEDGSFSFGNFAAFFQNSRLLTATGNTLLVSSGAAIGSVLIATPLAFGVARTNMWGKGLVKLAVIVSFASPPFLMAIAYVLIGGPNEGYANRVIRAVTGSTATTGPLDIFSLGGFVFLALPSTIAFVFIIMLPGFINMNPALEEASRISGAGVFSTLFRVSLPTMRAAMLAGALIAFSTALAMFATPAILGIDVLTVSMKKSILLGGDFGEAATIAAVSGVISMLVLFFYRRSLRSSERYQSITGKAFRLAPVDLGRARHLFTALGILYAVIGALLPYSLLMLISVTKQPDDGLSPGNFTLAHYEYIFGNQTVVESLRNSAILGVLSATIIAVLGFLIGYILTKTRLPGRALIDYITVLPLGIAGTAFAVGVVIVNLESPARALSLYATIWILLAAYIGRYIPFGVRTAQVALLQVSSELEEAARVGGASQLQTLWRVTFPLVRTGVAYAWILGFVQTFTEVSASAILSAAHSPVAAVALLDLTAQSSGLQSACALGFVMFVITMVLVVIAQKVGGQAIVPDADKT